MESLLEYSDLTTRASILKNRIEIIEERLEEILPLEQSKLTHSRVYEYFFGDYYWTTVTSGQDKPALALKFHIRYNELMRKCEQGRYSADCHRWHRKIGIGTEPSTFWVYNPEDKILYISTVPTKFYLEYFTLSQLKKELYEIKTEIEERLKAIKTDKIDRPTKKPEYIKDEYGFIDQILIALGMISTVIIGGILGGILGGTIFG